MRRAVALAALGLGRTSPNPVVGCVVLGADGEVAGEGYHQQAGGPHAEVHALRAAGDRARGGTAVVTLEPCNHTGRTGPCAQALIDAGVARVVYAVADPTDQAGGGGAALRAAGIDVRGGLLAEEAARGNEVWLTATRLGRPFVLWKYAATLDGRTAAADGTSRWITGPEARAEVHRLRAEADAVLVGSGTLRADDPHLAVRHGAGGTVRQPLRVVADSTAATPAAARVLDGAAPTLIAVAPGADTAHLTAAVRAGRAAIAVVPRASGGGRGLDPHALLAELHARGVRSVLLEGGPTLAGAFWAAGLVDKVIGYLAPALLGAGPTALRDAGIGTIGEAFRLDVHDIARIGPDVRLTAYPQPEPHPLNGSATATPPVPAQPTQPAQPEPRPLTAPVTEES
ncbi:bifunctional diaminohydroxyphosphoribosylaminopyrimidine deaminase/5-amino-6-(5-phosphoribosylamino)uracil reductase RibD [Peterkaempfera bronchialis]|uniref:Riboflavin biosynthesis protein RibD n=1 Tax=Peterkaempfera bronchialis TaxID=2126346 RepID=A0A345T6Y4_9ACTN|nr:bifunctional diaminohydroxyphosphoribosylaminopyrimidine deaminase/5-amino-6-(5-phosphoribosylamino)uracil reductase RibD [Peterkaempfera bronchialis]AXI81739.1 bifunctional diaminohydroxyphosphoribosylaminopyrimidine deaminase/5-amino-6-(5-phosphoribosylamino)uracil reductase RibD [Peterkaempfera bronchialis]